MENGAIPETGPLTLDQATRAQADKIRDALARTAAGDDGTVPPRAPDDADPSDAAATAEDAEGSGQPEAEELEGAQEAEEVLEHAPADDADDADDSQQTTGMAIDLSATYTLADGRSMSGQELQNSILRHADYTRKVQQTSNIVNEVHAEAERIDRERQDLELQRQQLQMQALLGGQEPMRKPELPSDDLLRTDPEAYYTAQARYLDDYTRWSDQQEHLQRAQQQDAQRRQVMAQRSLQALSEAGYRSDKQLIEDVRGVLALGHTGLGERDVIQGLLNDDRAARLFALAVQYGRSGAAPQQQQQRAPQPSPSPPPTVGGAANPQPATRRGARAAQAEQQARDADGRFKSRETPYSRHEGIEAVVAAANARVEALRARRRRA